MKRYKIFIGKKRETAKLVDDWGKLQGINRDEPVVPGNQQRKTTIKKRVERDCCIACGKPISSADTSRRCRACAEKACVCMMLHKHSLRLSGLCQYCGKSAPEPGKLGCPECLMRRKQATSAYRAR